MAVGGSGVSVDYVKKLYLFALVCEEVRALVDSETDARKSLTAFERAVKHCVDLSQVVGVVDGDESRTYMYSENYLTTEEQIERFSGKPKGRPKGERNRPLKLAKVGADTLARLDAGDEQAKAIAAFLRWHAGDAGALPTEIVEVLTAAKERDTGAVGCQRALKV
jgi:hypothetical protein